MPKYPLVYVIVVNYNGAKYLNACLSSLYQQSYPNYKVVVYDNASTDNSPAVVKEKFPQATLIQAVENQGFAKANNAAVKLALNARADYVFLVNNDTESHKDLIGILVNTLENNKTAGVAGPAVFDLQNKRSMQEMGVAIDKFGYPLALRKEGYPFFVSGCAMMIKAMLIQKFGLFDEKLFMFAEDLDFCWRLRLAGYDIAVNPVAKIYHASGGSMLGGVIKESGYRTNFQRIYLRERNTLRALIKNYSTDNILTIVPFYVGLLVLESFFWLFAGNPIASRNILKAITWNLKHLQDTFRERAKIQGERKICDRKITKHMLSGYNKLAIFTTVGMPKFEKIKPK
ncbi:MAG: glycosyltransferase family 2 protein [Candidatus Bathyarchaeota archaeon]|nr:glycosyltransferase family 2 protein [Candidatus Bathyarchaeota archaeon]